MFPVFSLVLDKDVDEAVCLRFPEIYKVLVKGRSLSYKTFFIWFLASVYQGILSVDGAEGVGAEGGGGRRGRI